jgi:hypothetical protein
MFAVLFVGAENHSRFFSGMVTDNYRSQQEPLAS